MSVKDKAKLQAMAGSGAEPPDMHSSERTSEEGEKMVDSVRRRLWVAP